MPLEIKHAELSEPVTRHMSWDYPRLNPGQTVREALAEARRNPPQSRIIYFYVVDSSGKLEGVVPTRRLLLSPDDTPIGDIMVKNVITVPESATGVDACEFFVLHRLLAFPVVDAQRRLLGVIDIDLYTEGLDEIERSERNTDLFQLIGVQISASAPTSSWAAFRTRFPWLLANIGGGIAAAFISGIFEADLARTVQLALFIPVVLALAESVSIQSVSLALQWSHMRPLTWSQIWHDVRQEIGTGFLLGAVSSGIVAVVALAWLGMTGLAITLWIGITGGVTCAAAIGLALPTVLRKLDRDPQVAAGPIALVSADMITLTLYLTTARVLM